MDGEEQGWGRGGGSDGVCNVRCNTWPSEEDNRMGWGGGDERIVEDDTS